MATGATLRAGTRRRIELHLLQKVDARLRAEANNGGHMNGHPQEPDKQLPQPAEERPVKTSRGWDSPVVGGLLLILIGAIFLFRGSDLLFFDNWWALFIAIPGAVGLFRAWNLYEKRGKLDSTILGIVTGSLFPLLVAAIFLLELDWGTVWPLFLVLAGLSILANRHYGQDDEVRE